MSLPPNTRIEACKTTKMYKRNDEITEKLYKNANPNAGAAGANTDAGANGTAEGPKTDENGNVYDADYKVEDDNDKK